MNDDMTTDELMLDELRMQWLEVYQQMCDERDDQKRIALIERLKELERLGARRQP